LIRGNVVLVCRPNFEHGELMTELAFALKGFVKEKKLGSIISGDSGVYLERGPDTVRGPDVYFISKERRPSDKESRLGYLDVAPELCVEIVLPKDRWSKIISKVDMFLNAGVKLIWIIDPKTRKAHIFRADKTVAMLDATGALSGETVLPGFELSLHDLFAVLA
jgi:Uma2 family endonuclease